MFEAPRFGKGVDRRSVGLGVVGLFAAVSLLFSVTPIAMVTVFSLIAFHFGIGRKLARLTSNFGVQSEGARFDGGVLVDAK